MELGLPQDDEACTRGRCVWRCAEVQPRAAARSCVEKHTPKNIDIGMLAHIIIRRSGVQLVCGRVAGRR